MRKAKPFVPVKPRKSCGKNRYKSREEADNVAREQEIVFYSDDLRLKSYSCANCGGWHLTRESARHHI
jgi:hypothetical protein